MPKSQKSQKYGTEKKMGSRKLQRKRAHRTQTSHVKQQRSVLGSPQMSGLCTRQVPRHLPSLLQDRRQRRKWGRVRSWDVAKTGSHKSPMTGNGSHTAHKNCYLRGGLLLFYPQEYHLISWERIGKAGRTESWRHCMAVSIVWGSFVQLPQGSTRGNVLSSEMLRSPIHQCQAPGHTETCQVG